VSTFYLKSQLSCTHANEWVWDSTAFEFFNSTFKIIAINMWNCILVFEIMEQYAMWTLIENEKDRSVGEILFDYNNENMENSDKDLGPKDYRRKELKLQKIFYMIIVWFIIVDIFISAIENVAPQINIGTFNLWILFPILLYSILALLLGYQQYKLSKLMWKMHYFEY
jgi:hypothetical protein